MSADLLEEVDDVDTIIEVINNQIYFYDEVSVKNMLKLCKTLCKIENQMLKLQVDFSLDKPPKIFLHIQSTGGDAYAGLSAMNTIENMKVPVVTIVDGFVASAATFIFFGGSERWMQKNSSLLIHQIRTEFWGRFEEQKDDFKNSSSLMADILSIYTEKSDIPEKKLKRIMKRELHLDANTCSKYKIIHKII
jgi:ATP-dependent protease ClpP protease subunit